VLAKLKEPVRFSPELNASLADLMASARWGAGLIAAKVDCRTLGAYSKPDSPDGVTQFRAVEKVVTSESAVIRSESDGSWLTHPVEPHRIAVEEIKEGFLYVVLKSPDPQSASFSKQTGGF
jgi:hypothetical protein